MNKKHVVKPLTGSEIRKRLDIGPDIIKSVTKLRGNVTKVKRTSKPKVTENGLTMAFTAEVFFDGLLPLQYDDMYDCIIKEFSIKNIDRIVALKIVKDRVYVEVFTKIKWNIKG